MSAEPRALGPTGLVLLGPLHSEERVHSCWLPLRVTEGLLFAVLLGPGSRPGRGSQAAGPGQRVQAWWEQVGSAGPGVSSAATGLGADLPTGGLATHGVPWVLSKCECQAISREHVWAWVWPECAAEALPGGSGPEQMATPMVLRAQAGV